MIAMVRGTGFQHASGDDEDGCITCWLDQMDEGLTTPRIRPCTTPEPDPLEPGLCRWCSHAVEPVTPPVGLSCGDCENVDCRCTHG